MFDLLDPFPRCVCEHRIPAYLSCGLQIPFLIIDKQHRRIEVQLGLNKFVYRRIRLAAARFTGYGDALEASR